MPCRSHDGRDMEEVRGSERVESRRRGASSAAAIWIATGCRAAPRRPRWRPARPTGATRSREPSCRARARARRRDRPRHRREKRRRRRVAIARHTRPRARSTTRSSRCPWPRRPRARRLAAPPSSRVGVKRPAPGCLQCRASAAPRRGRGAGPGATRPPSATASAKASERGRGRGLTRGRGRRRRRRRGRRRRRACRGGCAPRVHVGRDDRRYRRGCGGRAGRASAIPGGAADVVGLEGERSDERQRVDELLAAGVVQRLRGRLAVGSDEGQLPDVRPSASAICTSTVRPGRAGACESPSRERRR